MSGSEHRPRELKLDHRVNTLAWAPDGRRLAVGEFFGEVAVLADDGELIWRGEQHDESVYTLDFSPDGAWLASSSDDETVAIWDARTGVCRRVISPPGTDILSVSWASDSRRIACDAAPFIAQIWHALDGECLMNLEGHAREVLCVAFSPRGDLLATGSDDRTIRLWDAQNGAPRAVLEGHRGRIEKIAWSSDGHLLASGAKDGTVRLWGVETGVCIELSGHTGPVHGLAFSPDGSLVASASPDRTMRLWSPETGVEVDRVSVPPHPECSLAFSPDGSSLAAAFFDRILRIWDVARLIEEAPPVELDDFSGAWVIQQAASVGRRPDPDAPHRPVSSAELSLLPAAWASLHRLGIDVSLGRIRELLRWTASRSGVPEIDEHPGLERLRRLRWPASARVGFLALLLRGRIDEDSRRLPGDVPASELREALDAALSGEAIDPQVDPTSISEVLHGADVIDDRLLTLLETLGPRAVAADPGLPLKQLSRAVELPALSAPQRRLLALHVDLGAGGSAQGRRGGVDRIGIASSGEFKDLLKRQLALPREVFAVRQARGETLFHARSGRELPRLRPTVLVLDVSPPVFGPIEAVTRLAAHTIARSLHDAGLPTFLLTVGGEGKSLRLAQRADLLEIWTARSLHPVDASNGLRQARRLREQLREGPLEPVIVLLAPSRFGEDESLPSRVDGLRALFVDLPGDARRVPLPPLADACEQWDRIEARASSKLAKRLGGLMR